MTSPKRSFSAQQKLQTEEENPCFPQNVPEVEVNYLSSLLQNPELSSLFEQDSSQKLQKFASTPFSTKMQEKAEKP